MSETTERRGFDTLHLPQDLLRKLDRLGFVTPTPIQREAIPVALEGRDLIGIAQTGTGKTLAFGLPMLTRLSGGKFGLVLAPTRELAQQIQETFEKLNVKTALLIGGAAMSRQVSQLRSRPTIVVATPGRLLDHVQQRTLQLAFAEIVVLDEADRMLDMGFLPAIRRILAGATARKQTLLFSATMPEDIRELSAEFMRSPARIEIERPGTAGEQIEQQLVIIPHEDKADVLEELLASHLGTVLVFARTRHGTRKLAKSVHHLGHSVAEIHSDRTLAQRQAALHGFKTGRHRVLVATDIAARGIDVKEISLVINYDVPDNPEDYIHRIGRTGRAGASGKAITLATPEQRRDIRDIEKLLGSEIPVSPLSTGSFMERHSGFRRRPASRPGPSVRKRVAR